MKKLWGIRVHEQAETLGLDVSEHGMWGYPEFYIPVPGGYDNWGTPPWSRETPTTAAPPPPSQAVPEGA
jgi:ammonium transporter, Amt family